MSKPNLIFLSPDVTSARYGVGTYIESVRGAVQDHFSTVNLLIWSDESRREKDEYGINLFVRKPIQNEVETYSVTVADHIKSLIADQRMNVLHFNYFASIELLKLLRCFENLKLVYTEHYNLFASSIALGVSASKEEYTKYCSDYETFLSFFDLIIIPSTFSMKSLTPFAKKVLNKVFAVPHSVEDEYNKNPAFWGDKKTAGFDSNEILLLYVGRIVDMKGIRILLSSFNLLSEKYDNVRLIVVGGNAGDSNIKDLVMIKPGRLSCLRFQSKKFILDLYRVADIGVFPSFYEEFGLVVEEMMMMGLPVVSSSNGGLDELVVDGVNGLKADISSDPSLEEQPVQSLTEKLAWMIEHPDERKAMGLRGRDIYLKKYGMKEFREKMLSLYGSLFSR